MTLRRARVSNFEESMTNEFSEQILSELKKRIKKRGNVGPREKDKALIVMKVFEDIKNALDVAFSVGVLVSKIKDQAKEESVIYSFSLPRNRMKEELNKARKQLHRTAKLFKYFLRMKYRDGKDFFYHWFIIQFQ